MTIGAHASRIASTICATDVGTSGGPVILPRVSSVEVVGIHTGTANPESDQSRHPFNHAVLISRPVFQNLAAWREIRK
jgi:hypothetical protein